MKSESGIIMGKDSRVQPGFKWFGPRAFDWNMIVTPEGSCSVFSENRRLCELTQGSVFLFSPGRPAQLRGKDDLDGNLVSFRPGAHARLEAVFRKLLQMLSGGNGFCPHLRQHHRSVRTLPFPLARMAHSDTAPAGGNRPSREFPSGSECGSAANPSCATASERFELPL